MKVLGFWSGHDSSYAVLDEGRVAEHVELERHARIKEPAGDSADLFWQHNGNMNDVVAFATVHKADKFTMHPGWGRMQLADAKLHVYGHHQAHAANAFYSSKFRQATVLTIDGGGIEDEMGTTAAASIWSGVDNKLTKKISIPDHQLNIGGLWTRLTRYIFRYESGWPQGHQAGTVMALAAMGDPGPWLNDFNRFFKEDQAAALMTPQGHIKGMSAKDPQSPQHPFLKKWEMIAQANEQDKFNMAASLQLVTENYVNMLVKLALETCKSESRHLCLSGGVALNSVAMGKLLSAFPQLEKIYIPPVPYDGGLCIGAAQYHWHHVMDKKRYNGHVTPYLGIRYDDNDVSQALIPYQESGKISVEETDDRKVIELLDKGQIVAVFNGRAESGRRALGNRSILADPRNPAMKDRVNDKVKHRQWFRPFAPSILREDVKNWFDKDVDSPYMSFVLSFLPEMREKVPAVVHFDGSARLQTVSYDDNPWYHELLQAWKRKSGVPILLNTSFNDREPICETPKHALNCFLRTDIDCLYFVESRLLVKKRTTPSTVVETQEK